MHCIQFTVLHESSIACTRISCDASREASHVMGLVFKVILHSTRKATRGSNPSKPSFSCSFFLVEKETHFALHSFFISPSKFFCSPPRAGLSTYGGGLGVLEQERGGHASLTGTKRSTGPKTMEDNSVCVYALCVRINISNVCQAYDQKEDSLMCNIHRIVGQEFSWTHCVSVCVRNGLLVLSRPFKM